jgi:hypothetical protein
VVARKGENPHVGRFRDSDHKLAAELRKDTQGTVTNPALITGRTAAVARSPVIGRTSLARLERRLTVVENSLGGRLRGDSWTGARLTPRAAEMARRLRNKLRRSEDLAVHGRQDPRPNGP